MKESAVHVRIQTHSGEDKWFDVDDPTLNDLSNLTIIKINCKFCKSFLFAGKKMILEKIVYNINFFAGEKK
jgi:hypothetical protein